MLKALLLLVSAGKLGPLLVTLGSMLLSVVIYAQLFGWAFAVGFVGLLLVHELGHYLAARQRGLAVGAPTFIPFVGAWIELKTQPMSVETEAWVALAGPLLGTLGAMGCYYLGRHGGGNLWLALAYMGCLLNLFNLIPLTPFDGGRIVAILSPKLWLVGIPVLVALFFYRPSPLLLLVAVLAAPQVWGLLRGRLAQPASYYRASLEQKLQYGCYYLGLLAFLAIMSQHLHQQLAPLRG
ncbi:site-2 protease family protein [Pseudaeromonas sp. ZJS20]|uniref:site-2 protease family protein n=1 Tax=Pseudaeromonas aegiceratis TaxID=3153928 RepID=UPI00390C5EA0